MEEIRRRWFEDYFIRTNKGVIKSSQAGVRFTCPCCGYPTLDKRGGYDICILCNWEDDGQDDPHADEVWGGPIGTLSLSQARTNFKQNQTSLSDKKAKSPVEELAKQAIMATFDAMKDESDPKEIDLLWMQVIINEEVLRHEMDAPQA
jgi:hypothetical protein